ncbi:hypothetical protein A2U01_0008878, partial [Trifolium medium]|nr:hypothetical protein [Trifolium medium]
VPFSSVPEALNNHKLFSFYPFRAVAPSVRIIISYKTFEPTLYHKLTSYNSSNGENQPTPHYIHHPRRSRNHSTINNGYRQQKTSKADTRLRRP